MIFKLHYGFWWGALVGIIPFMFNYASDYIHVSGTKYGILYTIVPFVALIAKPAVCSVADKYALHHHCLLFFIFTTILGYGSLAIYPFFPNFMKTHPDLLWILFCLAAVVGNTSMCVVNSIGDSLAINSCQKNNVTYGSYRMWGPVGFGIFGFIWGIGNQIYGLPDYTPGILTLVVMLCINSLLLAYWYDRDEFKILSRVETPTNVTQESDTLVNNGNTATIDEAGDTNRDLSATTRMALLLKLAKQHNSIFAFLLLFTFCGVMTGIHWQFFFAYLKDQATTKNESFTAVTTLALPVQALGGELVFFMLSGQILKKLGPPLTLVICLLSFATRYLMYAYVIPSISLYWILLVELLQGPAFGLMYTVLTHQANYYSEKIDQIVASNSSPVDEKVKNSLHATLQGVLGASFEGLGLGLGAIIGGRAYDITTVLMWKIAGFSSLIAAILVFALSLPKLLPHSIQITSNC